MASVTKDWILMHCGFLTVLAGIHVFIDVYAAVSVHGLQKSPSAQCALSQKSLKTGLDYKYYQGGDYIVGGLFSVNSGFPVIPSYRQYDGQILCLLPNAKLYTDLLTFIFAVDEVNKNPNLLPNITLGYHVYDTCGDKITYIYRILNIVSGVNSDVPNYSCSQLNLIAGFVSETFESVEILNLYNHPKISYGSANSMQRDADFLKTYFTIFQNDKFWAMTIISLLKYFEWNLVGIIVSHDSGGDSGLWHLSNAMAGNGICTEFILKVSNKNTFPELQNIIHRSRSKVIIICGQFSLTVLHVLNTGAVHHNITLILNESWFTNFPYLYSYFQVTNCSLIFLPFYKSVPGLVTFLSNVNLIDRPGDPLLEDIYFFHGNCSLVNISKVQILQAWSNISLNNCTNREHDLNLLAFYSNHSSYHSVYTAVNILAHALHNMDLYLKKNYTGSRADDHSHMVTHFVRRIAYMDYNADKISFTEDREVRSQFPLQIMNLVIVTNNVMIVNTGISFTAEDQRFHIPNKDTIVWKNAKRPQSRCNERCSPGYRKVPKAGHQDCCYDCVSCSEGEISQVTDSEICHRCPDDERPDRRKVKCLPKTYEFLSYVTEEIVIVFTFTTILLCAVTLLILGIFIHYWHSPIVRANNRTVSVTLLVSILLNFLCVFLFLGRPVDITCMLRQTIAGIFFSVSVSSVLSKTITVYIAFKATKPCSVWRRWISKKTSPYVVVICSSVQVIICACWMSVSPPYQEYDMVSYADRIIIQCNEGSDLWFYSMLGYMGLLAAVSFLLAFMVRTLPDTFNEAKYITFSMLLFCSVWMSMIPAFLSTKGKYMVAMEIFAILASCTGILGFIFLPKCYMILIKTDIHVKRNG